MLQSSLTLAKRPQPGRHMKKIVTTLLAGLGGYLLVGGPALAQEREWMLDAANDDAFLVFGVPETDDVGVSFWCKIGSGRIKIFFPEGSAELAPDTVAEFSVTAEGKAYALRGKTSANAMTGATSIESELDLTDPLIVDLEKSDRFVAKIGHHELTYPLIDAGLSELTKLCRSKG